MKREEIPEKLIVENFYDYIRTKASLFLKLGCERYRPDDAFGRPDEQMEREYGALLEEGCRQVMEYAGLSPEAPFTGLGIEGFYLLMELFHYQVIGQRIHSMTGDYILDEMVARHRMTNMSMKLYNQVSGIKV